MRRHALCVLLAAFALSAGTTALAQRGSVEGEVVMEDGSPVTGVLVTVRSMATNQITQKVKTKKKGQFVLPFVDIGTYRFRAAKDGLLIKSISATTVGPNHQPENEHSSEVGALQELPELRLRSSRTIKLRFVMVPASHFADVLVVQGSREATRLLSEANDLAIQGKHEESNELLRGIVEQGTENAKVYYLLGTNAYALGQAEEAGRWLQTTAELDPTQPGLHAYLGSLASDRGDLEQAIEEYDKELEFSPDSSVVAINRAVLLIRLGRKEEAATALRDVIDKSPGEAEAYSELAGLYLEMGREQEAADILDRLETVGQADPAMWFNIGAGFSNRDLPEQAYEAYRKALELDPEFADAIRELGYLEIQRGERQSAVDRFERYLELRPDAADADSVRSVRQALLDMLAKQ